MSGPRRNLVSRSNTTGSEGTIRTENPELLKLLQESSSDSNIRRNTGKADKATQGQPADNHRDGHNSKNLQNILNLFNSSKVDHLKGENPQVSAAGDAKTSASERKGKENVKALDKPGFGKIKEEPVIRKNKENCSSGRQSDQNINPEIKISHQTSENDTADTRHTEKDVPRKVEDTDLPEAGCSGDEKSNLSDIQESDRETLSSSSSELARLKSPLRESPDADFQDSSFPSSPIHPAEEKSGFLQGRNQTESERNLPVVRPTRTAVRTPHPTIFKKIRETREGYRESFLDKTGDNSEEDIIETPENLREYPSSCAISRPTKTLLGTTTQSSTTGGTFPRSIAVEEKHRKPTNQTRNQAESPTIKTTTNAPALATLPAAKQTPTPRVSKPNAAFSVISPRHSKSSFRSTLSSLAPWDSQSSTNAISPRLLNKYVTTNPDIQPRDAAGIDSYSSRRLKAHADLIKEPAGKEDFSVKDSLDKEGSEFDPDSLEIERDSLELVHEKVKNSDSTNEIVTQYDNEADDQNTLKNNYSKKNADRDKLKGKTGDDDGVVWGEVCCDKFEGSSPSENKSPGNERPGDSSGGTTNPKKDSSDNKTQILGQGPDIKGQRQDIQDQGQNTKRQGQQTRSLAQRPGRKLSAPMIEPEEADQVEFVLKADPNKHSASKYFTAPGSAHSLGRGSNHSALSSATRNSTRTTPSVKKVYVESPTFTKEEEEVYRFVSSRLEDNKVVEGEETYRELDMAAIHNQETNPLRARPQKQVRYQDVDGRYEDTEEPTAGAKQGPLQTNTRKGINDLRNGRYNEDTEVGQRQFPRRQQQTGNHPALLQQHSNPEVMGFRSHSYDITNTHDGSYNIPKDSPMKYGEQSYGTQSTVDADQWDGFNVHRDPFNISQSGYNQTFSSLNKQGTNTKAISSSQQGTITFHGPPDNQQELRGNNVPPQQHPATRDALNVQQQPHHLGQQEQETRASKQPVRGLTLPVGPTYDPVDEEDLRRETTYQQGLRLRVEDGNRRTQEATVPTLPPRPLGDPQHDGPQDFVQDSLNYDTGDDTARSFGQGFLQDSLNMYNIPPQQPARQFRNPPQLPQEFVNYGNNRQLQNDRPNYDESRQFHKVHPSFDGRQFQNDHPSFDGRQFQNDHPSYGDNSQFQNGGHHNYGESRQFHKDHLNYDGKQFHNDHPSYGDNKQLHNDRQPYDGRQLQPDRIGYDGRQQPASRLDNVNFDSEDYTEPVDIRQQRVNPQIRPKFYNPHANPQQGHLPNEGEYSDEERNRAEDEYRLSQRYEDRQEDDEEEPMEAVQPRPPKYDYVNNNKEDLGLHHPKSYIKIHEVNRGEKERLTDFFIQPKPKQKGAATKKGSQHQQRGQQIGDFQPSQDENRQNMSNAEKAWTQRSATLTKKLDGNNGGRNARRGPGSLQKYNSDSSLSQASVPHRKPTIHPEYQQQHPNQPPQQQQHPTPEQRAFMTEMPTPLAEGGFQNQLPSPAQQQRPTEISVQPITQQILTQDGQRISVDVNLKLISPPTYMDGTHHILYQEPGAQQYQPPRHYQGRQYPAAIANYNDGGGRALEYQMPAMEYHPVDYDSDVNDYRHGSPRERYSADEALRIMSQSRTDMNPYGKVPPIGAPYGIEHPSSAPGPDQVGSYVDLYMRQKHKDTERPWYKVYGLKDYRRMQKEVRLGTLGPDLDNDAAREKREKVTRQSDYAKLVMEKNKNEMANRKPTAFPRPKEDNDLISRRRLAIEYAKSVPKPAVRVQPNEYNNYELAAEKSPIAKHHRNDGDKNFTPRPAQNWKKEKEMDILDLDKLRQRYEEDKQNEAIIRRNVNFSNRETYY